MSFGFGNADLAFRKTSPLRSPSQRRKYSSTAWPFAVPNPSAKTARGRRRRRSTAPSQRKGPRPVQGEQLPDATFPIERRREGADRGDRGVGVEADVVERPRPTIVDVRERPGVARVVFRRGQRVLRAIDAAGSPPRDDRGCCRAECVHCRWTASSPSFNKNDNRTNRSLARSTTGNWCCGVQWRLTPTSTRRQRRPDVRHGAGRGRGRRAAA